MDIEYCVILTDKQLSTSDITRIQTFLHKWWLAWIIATQKRINYVQNVVYVKFLVMNLVIGKISAKAKDSPFGKICT